MIDSVAVTLVVNDEIYIPQWDIRECIPELLLQLVGGALSCEQRAMIATDLAEKILLGKWTSQQFTVVNRHISVSVIEHPEGGFLARVYEGLPDGDNVSLAAQLLDAIPQIYATYKKMTATLYLKEDGTGRYPLDLRPFVRKMRSYEMKGTLANKSEVGIFECFNRAAQSLYHVGGMALVPEIAGEVCGAHVRLLPPQLPLFGCNFELDANEPKGVFVVAAPISAAPYVIAEVQPRSESPLGNTQALSAITALSQL